MKIKKVIIVVLTVIAAIFGIIGALLILGTVGEMETNPLATTGWFFRRMAVGSACFIPAVIKCIVEDDLDTDYEEYEEYEEWF